MKRNFTRTFSLLLTALLLIALPVGCVKQEQAAPPSPNQPSEAVPPGKEASAAPDAAPISPEETEPAETVRPTPDDSDFVMPEETGSLTVYTTDMLGVTLNPAVEIFKRLYPGVSVTTKTLGDDEYEALIRTEIPAGRGPDLLFSFGIDLPDIYKTVSAGIFEDLDPYLRSDPDYRPEDYVEGVMDGGLYRGGRYFLPVEYLCPILETTEETLADAGLTPEDFST